MFQKIKEKINNISTKLKNINEIYIDYILCITFLNLIILKLNQIFFKIPYIYLYPIILLISILFINQWFLITDKIKNTYLFNWSLYTFLIFKNGIYGLIFEYFNYVEQEKYTNLLVFLTGFVLSSWFLNILFLILNNSYNLSILIFFILLIINIFNLIEKKIIFNNKNLNNDQKIDYILVKNILKIENQKFNKNKSLFYIQKRYMHFNEIKNLIKKHGVTVITSATAGSLFTGYLQHSSVQVQKDQLEIQKEQFNFQKELELKKFEEEKLKEKESFQKWREELDLKKLKTKQKSLNEIDQKIEKYQLDMDTSNFWNKVDHSKQLDFLKRKRLEIKEDFEKIEEDKEFNIPKKKIKIDNNSLLDD